MDRSWSEDELQKLTVDELKAACREVGLSLTGRKVNLVARLLDHKKNQHVLMPRAARRPTPDQPNVALKDLADEERRRIDEQVKSSMSELIRKNSIPIVSPPVITIKEEEIVTHYRTPEVKPVVDVKIKNLISEPPFTLAFVCHSNLNRSMEAHFQCVQAGIGEHIASFGAGGSINLPGKSLDSPVVFEFGTKYTEMFAQLTSSEHAALYSKNGVIKMLERNIKVKSQPERWQEDPRHFDIIVCFETRIFDIVLEDITSRSQGKHVSIAHVINIETPDNFTDARIGGGTALTLVKMLHASSDWESDLPSILDELSKSAALLHSVNFY